MKNFVLFISSLIIFFMFFACFGLDSFADGEDYPTAGVTIELTNSYNVTTSYTWNGLQFESIYPIVFYKDANSSGIFPVSPLAYGHSRSYRKVIDSYNTPNTPELVYGDWSSINWTSYSLDGNTYYYSDNGFNISAWNGQISNFHYSVSNVIVFNSLDDACNYLLDPSSTDNLDNIYDDIGKDIVQDALSPSINWGDNDPNDVDNPWRPDTENIPAPQFEVVYDENGNVTNQIRFSNYIYNYSAGHGEDRIYGLRMTIMWNSYGSFLFDHTGGLLSQEYKVTYSDLLVGDIDTVFAFPEKENEIVRCPQTFNFNNNQAVIDSFNDLLQTYDVDERTYNTNFSVSNDLTLTNKFKSFLERITCPYNTITFSVQYYRRMSDGTFHYGPWSTGKFTAPQQGAIFNANGVTLSGVGGMVQGNGGGLSGTDESGNWNNNWGNNTSDNLFNISDMDLDKVKANMTGLFSFFGEMPSFIQQCFLFLPDWVIAFIIACIVLVCAIGALKLALG